MASARVYLAVLSGVIAITFGGTQVWNLAFAFRNGPASVGLVASGVVGVPILIIGLTVVGRIFYVVGRSRGSLPVRQSRCRWNR